MGKERRFKFWKWVLQFKLSKKKDDEKISFIARELIKELTVQGYTLDSMPNLSGFNIHVHHIKSNKSYGNLTLSNILSDWEIRCGDIKL